MYAKVIFNAGFHTAGIYIRYCICIKKYRHIHLMSGFRQLILKISDKKEFTNKSIKQVSVHNLLFDIG